jgi:hypothetical protein
MFSHHNLLLAGLFFAFIPNVSQVAESVQTAADSLYHHISSEISIEFSCFTCARDNGAISSRLGSNASEWEKPDGSYEHCPLLCHCPHDLAWVEDWKDLFRPIKKLPFNEREEIHSAHHLTSTLFGRERVLCRSVRATYVLRI